MNIKREKNILIILLFCAFSFLLVTQNSEKVKADDTGIPFVIEAVHPENQVSESKNASYLDLLVKPNTKQDVSFDVTNLSDQEQHFVLDISDATTSDGLAIDYGRTNNKLTGSPKISEMIEPNDSRKKLSVPANSVQRVTFTLKYPSDNFKGLVLGGATIYMDEDYSQEDSKTSEKSAVGVSNLYRYSLAIQLRNKIEDAVSPNLSLVNATQTIENYHPVLKLNLQNTNPAYVSQVKTSSVVKNSNNETVEEYQTSLGQIAPISDFNLVVPLTKGVLKPGTYEVELAVQSDKTGQKWQFNKKIVVSEENSKETNKQDINRESFKVPWILIILVLLLFIIAILLIIIFKEKSKDKSSSNK